MNVCQAGEAKRSSILKDLKPHLNNLDPVPKAGTVGGMGRSEKHLRTDERKKISP